MGPREERLSERGNEILAPGARLHIALNERDGTREVEIKGNRQGLQALAAICSGLAELTTEELLIFTHRFLNRTAVKPTLLNFLSDSRTFGLSTSRPS